MKRKRLLITIVQILLVVVVAVALFMGYKMLVNPVKVYTFTQDIDSGIKITENMVKVVEVPEATLSSGNFLTSGKDLKDKVTTGKVYAGQYVLKQNVADSDSINPFQDSELVKGLRKVAIKATFETAAGGTLQKGDKVDLLLSQPTSVTKDNYQTKTFLTDVYVYNVIDSDGNTYLYDETKYNDKNDENSNKSDDENAYSKTLATVVLAVSPSDAETIVNNSKLGTISIATQFSE